MKGILGPRLLVKTLIAAPFFVGFIYLKEHHWPNEMGWVAFIVTMVALDTFEYIVKLMERQNALLEQVVGVLKADRQEYEEPLGRR